MPQSIFEDVGDRLKTKVTLINGRYHARLYLDEKVIDEMACKEKIDIAWICREMLRWFDKCGGISEWASAARLRHQTPPKGQVWYKVQLEK